MVVGIIDRPVGIVPLVVGTINRPVGIVPLVVGIINRLVGIVPLVVGTIDRLDILFFEEFSRDLAPTPTPMHRET
ncbi:MAG TPA: hypothetical protein VHY08_16900 [Bacillota bacterium]|nr:hypothetical protein [Bacillota bacterium]